MQKIIEDYLRSFGQERQLTAQAYRVDIGQLSAHLATKGVDDWTHVTAEQMTDYVRSLSESEYRPSTIARKCAAIRSFLRYLRTHEIITRDVLSIVTSLVVASPKPESPQIVCQEHLDQLFERVDKTILGGLRDLAMLQLLITTGLSASELIRLDLIDIDVEGASLSCRGRGAQKRVLSLSAFTVERIQCYLEQGRCARSDEEQALFVNHIGDRLSRQGLWGIIKGYANQVGISVTPRAFRHTYVVSLLRSGMSVNEVQLVLGCSQSALNPYLQFLNYEITVEGNR